MTSEADAPISWLELRFTCDAATADRIAGHLDACGALSVSLADAEDQPLYEPAPGSTPLWSSTRVSGLFAGDRDADALIAEIRRRLSPDPLPEAHVAVIADREWAASHRDAFAPICFGDRIWVVPSWSPLPALKSGQVIMRMDPGLAFGTGGHPTTRMCLGWLAGEDVVGREVVDYGCGSGILAVAAALLGARRVWAVDNDDQALTATRANVAANGVAAVVHACAPGSLPPLTAHLLVSNILANTLNTLAETLSALLRPGGRMALAGILADQSSGVMRHFAPWCALEPADQHDDWVLLAGSRRDTGI